MNFDDLTQEQKDKAMACKSVDEIIELAKSEGVELTDGAKWVLTGDSHIKSLKCEPDSIDLNGFTLTVDGETYIEGSTSEGSPVEYVQESEHLAAAQESGHDKGGKPPKKK